MGDSCGDPLIVVVKTDQVAEDFLQDGGRGEGRERKRERERERVGGRERDRERKVITWFVVIKLLMLQIASARLPTSVVFHLNSFLGWLLRGQTRFFHCLLSGRS